MEKKENAFQARCRVADAAAVKALMKLLRRERLEALVLDHINEMQALCGNAPAGSIAEACDLFRAREARQRLTRGSVHAEPASIWLARQIRAVVLTCEAMPGKAFKYVQNKHGQWRREWLFSAWQTAVFEEVNAVEAGIREAVKWN